MQDVNTSTEASVLEHNHWGSARPSPAHPRSSRSSSSLSADSLLSPASGSNHSPTTSTGQRRRRRSHVGHDEEDLQTSRPIVDGNSSHGGNRPVISITKAYDPHDGGLRTTTLAEGEISDGLEGEYTDDEEAGLTRGDRRSRRRRKKRETSIDGRIVEEVVGRSKEEKKLADIDVLKRLAVNVLLIGLW